MNEGKAYAGILMDNGTELSHYGVKGMKWGKHLFGLQRMTDAGTRANGMPNDANAYMKNFFAQRDARAKAAAAASAAKREAERRRAEAAAAEAEAKKKKKSSGSSKKGSSAKAKEEKPKKGELSKELVEKLKDPNAQLTKDEIRQRGEYGIKKAKELLRSLSDFSKNPSLDEIDELWDRESDQRGVGYDAFVIEIATNTAKIKYYEKQINDMEKKFSKTKDVTEKQQLRTSIGNIKRTKAEFESDFKRLLKTGHSNS